MKKLMVVAGIALVGLASVAIAGSRHNPAPAYAAPAAVPVFVSPATQRTIRQEITVMGSLVSLNDVTLSSKLSGRLASVAVREGDHVHAGEVVAQIDTTDLVAQVRSAEGDVAVAQARVAQSQAALGQQTIESATAIESASAALGQQKVDTSAGIASAESGLRAAEAALSQTKEGSRRQEVMEAEAADAIAQANLKKADADLKRYTSLEHDGAVAPATLDQFSDGYEVARQQANVALQQLSLVREGARSQELVQAEQAVRQAQDRLRQARAAAALDQVRTADLDSARAGVAQVSVRKADVQVAQAGLLQAESGLQIARQALRDASVVSPIDGSVASRSSEPGQVVAVGAPVVRIVSLSAICFDANVPERSLGDVHFGQPVRVIVDAFAGTVFTGKVVRIWPAGITASRSFVVRVAVANTDGLLRPGLYASGKIVTSVHPNAVTVPAAALLPSTGGESGGRLYTVANGRARLSSVHVGLTANGGQDVEVSGVAAGTPVVISGQGALSDGDPVIAQSE